MKANTTNVSLSKNTFNNQFNHKHALGDAPKKTCYQGRQMNFYFILKIENEKLQIEI